jgi:hypothetical protein
MRSTICPMTLSNARRLSTGVKSAPGTRTDVRAVGDMEREGTAGG